MRLVSSLAALVASSSVVFAVEDERVAIRKDAVAPDGPLACLPVTDVMGPHESLLPRYDIGGGLVANVMSYVAYQPITGSRWIVSDCLTGQLLFVEISEIEYTEAGEIGFDNIEEFNAFFGHIDGASQHSLSSLQVQASSFGLETISTQSDQETCGCAAFYPELKGAETAYRDGTVPAIIHNPSAEVVEQ